MSDSQVMTTDAAYRVTIAAVRSLVDAGVDATIRVSRCRKDLRVVDKYSGSERVKPADWYHVSFNTDTPEKAEAVAAAARDLNKRGISFDTGGCPGTRDWELDWSFAYTGDHNQELDSLRDGVESCINAADGADLCKLYEAIAQINGRAHQTSDGG